jgi:hypothetical protein
LESIIFIGDGKKRRLDGGRNARRSQECRQHAERCAELARRATTSESRDTFLSLQLTWIRLAMELDQARAVIDATQELEEEQPIKAAE